MTKKIGFLLGSYRKDSYTQKIAETITNLLPKGFETEIIEISHLKFYNPDIDLSKEYKEYREKMNEKDAIIFITPEYNRTFPAILKNAIDIYSTPYGNAPWKNKKVSVISHSPTLTGGVCANLDLRKPLMFLGADLLSNPEMVLSKINDNFYENGKITARTEEFIKKFIETFIKHIG